MVENPGLTITIKYSGPYDANETDKKAFDALDCKGHSHPHI